MEKQQKKSQGSLPGVLSNRYTRYHTVNSLLPIAYERGDDVPLRSVESPENRSRPARLHKLQP